jgi:hypothetical protein
MGVSRNHLILIKGEENKEYMDTTSLHEVLGLENARLH